MVDLIDRILDVTEKLEKQLASDIAKERKTSWTNALNGSWKKQGNRLAHSISSSKNTPFLQRTRRCTKLQRCLVRSVQKGRPIFRLPVACDPQAVVLFDDKPVCWHDRNLGLFRAPLDLPGGSRQITVTLQEWTMDPADIQNGSLLIGVVFGTKPPLRIPFSLILISSPMTDDSNTMPPCPLRVLWMPCNVHTQTHPQGLMPGGLRNYAMPERLRFGFGCRSGIIISQVASLGLMLSRTPRLCCRANALTLALFGMLDLSTSWRSYIESVARQLLDRCYNRCHYACLHRLQVAFHVGPRTSYGTIHSS